MGYGWVVHDSGTITRPGAITITSSAEFANGAFVNTVQHGHRPDFRSW